MKKALILLVILLPASLILLSCGGYSSPSNGGGSGIKYRAFITNRVSAGTGLAGVYIVDAANDVRGSISPISAGNTPGMMVLTPNRNLTLVFSGNGTQFSDNQFTIVTNAGETEAGHVTLPGLTESFVVSPDSSTAYVAVPTAPVIGQSPGIVEAISLVSGTVTGQVNVPSAHYLSIDNSGNRILAFSDNSDSVAVITPSNIVTGNAVTYVSGFDRPVAAFFSSDDSTAYVVNCGAECGGAQASVQKLDLTQTQCLPTGVCPPINVPAGSVALVNGSTMYLAGTPYSGGAPSQACSGQTTAATTCGLLTIVDLSSMTIINTAPIIITDGYHNRIALGANGQLFIGARTCTEIIPPVPPPTGAEVRGCLSIYNTQNVPVGSIQPGAVTIPPTTGDVTGIQPIATRDVVYVVQGQNVQGGTLYVYDTKTDAVDAVEEQKFSNLIGDFVDIKTIDF